MGYICVQMLQFWRRSQMTHHQAGGATVDRPFFREQNNYGPTRQDAARRADLGTYRA
jgi:hypothetical protein